MFDIFYIGENDELEETFPFATKITDVSEAAPDTKMFWVVEPNITIIDFDVFDFRPEPYDQVYEHIWKRDNNNFGGLRLIPTSRSRGEKYVKDIVCKKNFDVLRRKNPGKYFEKNKYADFVWCVDPDYTIETIDWSPDNHEPDFIHCFHIAGQLRHKYPKEEGGVKLFPRDWKDAPYKYHGFLPSDVQYPVIKVDNVEDYEQRDDYDEEYVWLIDKDYQIDEDKIHWVPDIFDHNYVHIFKMPYQLLDRYPQQAGGIRLVPKSWKSAPVKFHRHCPVPDKSYQVFYIPHEQLTEETFDELRLQAKTEWFWVLDAEYNINGKLVYVPEPGEEQYSHLFKWGLDYRYPKQVEEVWDQRAAGVFLLRKDTPYNKTEKKLHTDVIPVKYDIFYTNNINDYGTYAALSTTRAFWLIDAEHIIEHNIKWIPPDSEKKFINIFKIPGQLTHKYPADITNVSDQRCGGAKLVPLDFENAQRKYQGVLNNQDLFVDYEIFEDEELGRAHSKHDWFWVIDPTVQVEKDFDFSYTPSVWDQGKKHIWQKLNPITKRQYDYAGVMLCPKIPAGKGRPKYITEPACIQKEFDVLYLRDDRNFFQQLLDFDVLTTNKMFWVVDPNVTLHPDFAFEYYPTQWDEKYVHVFMCSDNSFRGVRLFPKGTFMDKVYTDDEIINNSFDNLKELNTVATVVEPIPVEQLTEMTREELVTLLDKYQKEEVKYIWTLDKGVDPVPEVLEKTFIPRAKDTNKIHLWQRKNPHTNLVHSYGGLRLWPTRYDRDKITTDAVRLNKIKNVQYIKEVGAVFKPFDIVYLSYHEPNAQKNYNALKEKAENAIWIKDVEGIFEAHKAAAASASSKMFWVVDADAELTDDFSFDYIPDQYDQDVVHVWDSLNPITGKRYGYGGVKLFNRDQVLDATSWGLDFTTGLSNRFKVISQLSCITRFNVDEFSTWRSSFRECVKLLLKDDMESQTRYQAWANPVAEADFAEYAAQAAEQAKIFVEENKDNPLELEKINDFTWLRNIYDSNS